MLLAPEATEAMAGQEGQCPTCGNTIVIPILDRYGRLIDPMTGRSSSRTRIRFTPTRPRVNARRESSASPSGKQIIQCPRCQRIQPDHREQLQELRHAVHDGRHDAGSERHEQRLLRRVAGARASSDCPRAASVTHADCSRSIFGIIGYNQVSKGGGEGGGKGWRSRDDLRRNRAVLRGDVSPALKLFYMNGFEPSSRRRRYEGLCIVPWFVSGGWAIDLFLGRVMRQHGDCGDRHFPHDQLALQDHFADHALFKVITKGDGGEWARVDERRISRASDSSTADATLEVLHRRPKKIDCLARSNSF